MAEEWGSTSDDGQLVGIVSIDSSKCFECYTAPPVISQFQSLRTRRGQLCAVETSLLRMAEEWGSTSDDGQLVGIVSIDSSKCFECYTAPPVISQFQSLRTRGGQLCAVERQVKIVDIRETTLRQTAKGKNTVCTVESNICICGAL